MSYWQALVLANFGNDVILTTMVILGPKATGMNSTVGFLFPFSKYINYSMGGLSTNSFHDRPVYSSLGPMSLRSRWWEHHFAARPFFDCYVLFVPVLLLCSSEVSAAVYHFLCATSWALEWDSCVPAPTIHFCTWAGLCLPRLWQTDWKRFCEFMSSCSGTFMMKMITSTVCEVLWSSDWCLWSDRPE